MTGAALEKLFFTISLIDKVTKPGKGVSKTMLEIQRTARAGFMDIGKGALTIGSTAAAMDAFTTPARGFNKAVKEVSALDVAQKELSLLGAASKRAAMDFSLNATDIVSSGYDIQSSIEGLDNGELAKFTYNSALLGKAIKSTSGETTAYVSTMSGIFEKDAAKIGKGKWIDQLVGKTARAVQMFRTTGPEMKAAFAALGAAGSSQGIAMDEQIGILGMMQKITGSGAVAATQYKAFLGGAGDAQDKLGLKFTDSKGKMLPMADILDKIRGKFGDTIDVAEGLQLKKAFGSKEAVAAVTSMIDKTGALRKNVNELSKIKGLGVALKMAKEQVDPLEQFYSILNVLKITLGQGLLPIINMALGVFAKGMIVINWMMENIPGLKYVFGAIVLTISAVTMAMGAMWVMVGASNVLTAFTMKMHLVQKCLMAKGWLLRHATISQQLYNISLKATGKTIGGLTKVMQFLRLNLLWNKTVMIASAVWTKVMAAAQWFMNSSFWGGCVAVWSFTAALLACPLTWIVLGIMALVGAVVALIYYWDEVCSFVMKYGKYLLMLTGPVGLIAGLIIHFWDDIVAGAKWCLDFLWGGIQNFVFYWTEIGTVIWGAISWVFDKINGCFVGLWDLGTSIVKGILGFIVDKIVGFLSWMTKLPIIGGTIKSGLDALKEFAGGEITQTAKIERPVVPTVRAQRNQDIPAGGIGNSSSNKTTNFGGVTINTQNPVGPGQMEDMWMLEA